METFARINLYQDIDMSTLEQEGKLELPLFQWVYLDVLSQTIDTLIFIDLDTNRKKGILKSMLTDERIRIIYLDMLCDMTKIFSIEKMKKIEAFLLKIYEEGKIKFIKDKEINHEQHAVVLSSEEISEFMTKQKGNLRARVQK